MLKLASVVACYLVAWDCVDKALGLAPSVILTADYSWIWWLVAFGWAVIGALIVFTRFYTRAD
jgi:hypothetical protein